MKRSRDHWYYVDGVRYCSRCRSRRCARGAFGSIPCIPVYFGGRYERRQMTCTYDIKSAYPEVPER